ncbi:MAG: glutamyl-tRNA reductase [Planctomycetia bacterium]|nr:glutamyl-tRNA reductase [Planctomycetia bacterium]
MIWMAIGCRHKESNVSLRERLAFSEGQIREALALLKERYPRLEVVILSTCNRVEIYAAYEIMTPQSTEAEGVPQALEFPQNAELGCDILLDFLAEFHQLPAKVVRKNCFRFTSHEALRHLFLVASSLDSMIVGEAQIGGQVRAAYELAVECGSVGPLLHAAFQRAVGASKKVAAQTAVRQLRTSVPSVAVSCFAKQIFESFEDKQTLVIGAGKMAEETLLYLREEGAQKIVVVNRNFENARRTAEKFGGVARPWEELSDALSMADLVVSATGATLPVVTLEAFREIERRRDFRPLFVLDLAVPRDIDERIGKIPNVYLYTVDDLQAVCDQNQEVRNQDYPKAVALVDEQLDTFIMDIRHHKSGRVIAALRQKWEEQKRAELERLWHKTPDLSDEERKLIAGAFDRLMNKFLHVPMDALRREAADSPILQRTLLDAIRKLFHIQ